MNTIETIRAEVLRLYKDKEPYSPDRWDMGYDSACEDILSFLDTLQEQPVCEELEEEVHRFFEECVDVHEAKIYGVEERVIPVDCYELTARHFAQWQNEKDDRHLNWIRCLVKAGIHKPEEAVNILKRIDDLLNKED